MRILLDTCEFVWAISGDSALDRKTAEQIQDPFDRMLVCQALNGAFKLASSDPMIRQYPVDLL